ncbi:MAG: transcription antitermination factor NusB [bacterium]
MTRRQARKEILDCLYKAEMGVDTENSLKESIGDKQFEFINGFVKSVRENIAFCDGKISRHARNWVLSRINEVDKNILRMGIAEICLMKNEVKIAINEAVELAKKYSSEKSAAFINGILDKVAREQNPPSGS